MTKTRAHTQRQVKCLGIKILFLETDKQSSHPPLIPPEASNGWVQARPKLEAGHMIQLTHVGEETSSCASQGLY